MTHGGYGTVSAALTHGCPLVLLPISADQPINAARCTAAGVGVTLDQDDRTPEAIRAATREVLDTPGYVRAARETARELHDRPGVEHGLRLLEALARDRVPIPSR